MNRRSFLAAAVFLVDAACWLPRSIHNIRWDIRKRREPRPVPDCWTERDGDWNDPATWFEGRVPAAGDVVTVRHTIVARNIKVGMRGRHDEINHQSCISHLILECGANLTFVDDVVTDTFYVGK